ncbi:hypothetical protein GCM10011506_12030 [Marivirga lumbricoides]|uniref:SGNH/GDSL hydrolase family protein n=1 Tax=Marivirga lumbricoides TaxID=1046115 RepID=A0ABQ1LQF5_9BACT|nr:hypothetical protein GCM10011506_12030 [Marivirga lumbricoides]
MYKFLIKLLILLFFFVPIYIIFIGSVHLSSLDSLKANIKFKKGGNGHLFTRLKEADTIKNIDILVLGSSHAYRGIDPRVFERAGYKLFNLGSSSQSHIQTEFLVKEYLERLNPKIVLYEVYPNVFQNDGFESFIDLASNYRNPLGLWRMALKINSIPVYNTWIASLFDYAFNNSINFNEAIIKKDDIYISGGYVEKKKQMNNSIEELNSRKTEINNLQIESFESTIEFLNKKRIPTLLIQAPITSENYEHLHNRREFDNFFENYVKGDKVENYINYNNQKLPLDNSLHFYDSHHLNQDGVEVFNEFLLKSVKGYVNE